MRPLTARPGGGCCFSRAGNLRLPLALVGRPVLARAGRMLLDEDVDYDNPGEVGQEVRAAGIRDGRPIF